METLWQAPENNSLTTNMSSTCLISNCSKGVSQFQVNLKDMTGAISPLNMNDRWGRGCRRWHGKRVCSWEPRPGSRGCLPHQERSCPTWGHLLAAPPHRWREEQWTFSLCSSPRYHLGTSVHHDYWEQNNRDRISHPSSGYGGNRDASTQTTPLPALHPPRPPLPPPCGSFTPNWQTLDLHKHFVLRAHRPLETDWYMWERRAISPHLSRGTPARPPSCGPIVHCLILFREQLKPKVASIQREQVHRGGQRASLYLCVSQSLPSGLFQ